MRCLALLLCLATPLVAEERIEGSFKLGEARALSGHEIEIKGRRILMRDYRCPDPATTRGRDAKALMNQFLRTNITCVMVEDGGRWVGDCWANDKNVTDGMVGTGCVLGLGRGRVFEDLSFAPMPRDPFPKRRP
jgi:hypothetical protein